MTTTPANYQALVVHSVSDKAKAAFGDRCPTVGARYDSIHKAAEAIGGTPTSLRVALSRYKGKPANYKGIRYAKVATPRVARRNVTLLAVHDGQKPPYPVQLLEAPPDAEGCPPPLTIFESVCAAARALGLPEPALMRRFNWSAGFPTAHYRGFKFCRVTDKISRKCPDMSRAELAKLLADEPRGTLYGLHVTRALPLVLGAVPDGSIYPAKVGVVFKNIANAAERLELKLQPLQKAFVATRGESETKFKGYGFHRVWNAPDDGIIQVIGPPVSHECDSRGMRLKCI